MNTYFWATIENGKILTITRATEWFGLKANQIELEEIEYRLINALGDEFDRGHDIITGIEKRVAEATRKGE